MKNLVALSCKLVILLETLFVKSVEIDDCLIIVTFLQIDVAHTFWKRCGHRIRELIFPASIDAWADVVFCGGAFESVFVDG